MPEEKDTLDNFEGFENASDIDFFGEANTTAEPTEDLLQQVQEDTLPEGEAKKEGDDAKPEEGDEEKENLPDIDFFGEGNEDAKESGLEVKNEGDDKEGSEDLNEPEAVTSASTLSFLKEKGLVEFELEEGEELTEQKAEEILEDSYDEAVESRVQELMEEMPDEVKNIIKYSLDGGDMNTLLSNLVAQPTTKITKDLDLEAEANQEMVVRAAYKAKGEDADTTDSYIEFLKESGKLKDISEKEHGKIVAAQGKLAEAEAKRVADQKKAAKENHRKFKTELSGFIGDTKTVGGSLSITKKDTRELPNYIADRNVKLEDGRQVSGMQAALYEALKDKEKTVILAKLLKSDFDFSEIAKGEKTKVAREVQRDLTRSDKITPSTGSSQPKKKKAFADYF